MQLTDERKTEIIQDYKTKQGAAGSKPKFVWDIKAGKGSVS